MRIGIFGGAFDPPHKGHEKAAKAFLSEAELDLLYVIPSGRPPHKNVSGGAEDQTRLEMAKLAFSPLSEKICVSDLEIRRRDICYSYLTLQSVASLHPGSQIFLFAGTDQILSFETWKEFRYILDHCVLCAMDRYGEPSRMEEKVAQLERDFGARCLILRERAEIISSSEIRRDLLEKGFSHRLSPGVNDLITLTGSYSVLSDPDRASLVEKAKNTLSPQRLSHTLSVEREAVRLGEEIGLDKNEVRDLSFAALFHDLTKEWDEEEQVAFLKERGDEVLPDDLSSPAILHGRTAAYLARDSGLLSPRGVKAIYYHTTGRPGMDWEEKVLFFADYIEETRPHRSCRDMRAYFYENLPEKTEERREHLDRCILSVMEKTIRHLEKKGSPCHPLGALAMADMKKRCGKEPL